MSRNKTILRKEIIINQDSPNRKSNWISGCLISKRENKNRKELINKRKSLFHSCKLSLVSFRTNCRSETSSCQENNSANLNLLKMFRNLKNSLKRLNRSMSRIFLNISNSLSLKMTIFYNFRCTGILSTLNLSKNWCKSRGFNKKPIFNTITSINSLKK